jgi:hypothetical protein
LTQSAGLTAVRWNERVLGSISIRAPCWRDSRKMLLCHAFKCKSLGIRTKGLVFDCCADAVSNGILQNYMQNLIRQHFVETVANQPLFETRSDQDVTRSAHISFSPIPRPCCQYLLPSLHPLQSLQSRVGKECNHGESHLLRDMDWNRR